ncbi:hypothetical protein MSG28_002304 [Choristoneura fumiferana]|uniref:Uncharacterized protein n=1 Tax=Choristoneura fumiferana TaxID=7141 RepID=A0ACC0JV07_CHOFU|nr:hypothetical protein MSG28_002304 [Choristoneura fumiferana]
MAFVCSIIGEFSAQAFFLILDRDRLSALLKKLFESHVTGDTNEELVKAATNGDAARCADILARTDAHADVNGVFGGHTALQAAAQNGHLEVIRALVEAGADADAEDRDGTARRTTRRSATPLGVAGARRRRRRPQRAEPPPPDAAAHRGQQGASRCRTHAAAAGRASQFAVRSPSIKPGENQFIAEMLACSQLDVSALIPVSSTAEPCRRLLLIKLEWLWPRRPRAVRCLRALLSHTINLNGLNALLGTPSVHQPTALLL